MDGLTFWLIVIGIVVGASLVSKISGDIRDIRIARATGQAPSRPVEDVTDDPFPM